MNVNTKCHESGNQEGHEMNHRGRKKEIELLFPFSAFALS